MNVSLLFIIISKLNVSIWCTHYCVLPFHTVYSSVYYLYVRDGRLQSTAPVDHSLWAIDETRVTQPDKRLSHSPAETLREHENNVNTMLGSLHGPSFIILQNHSLICDSVTELEFEKRWSSCVTVWCWYRSTYKDSLSEVWAVGGGGCHGCRVGWESKVN